MKIYCVEPRLMIEADSWKEAASFADDRLRDWFMEWVPSGTPGLLVYYRIPHTNSSMGYAQYEFDFDRGKLLDT